MNIYKTKIEEKKAKIAELQAEIESLEEEKISLTPTHELAITLHSMLCKHNHTDGCSWWYEVTKEGHEWNRSEHAQWLTRAATVEREIQKLGFDIDTALAIYNVITRR